MSWFGFGKKPSAQSDFKVLAENAQRNVDAVTAAQQAKAAAEQAVKEAKERADLAVKETAQRAAIAKAFEDASLGGKNTITFVEEKDIHPTIAKELKDTGYTITAGTEPAAPQAAGDNAAQLPDRPCSIIALPAKKST